MSKPLSRRNFVQQVGTVSLGLGLGFKAIQKWYNEQDQPFHYQFPEISRQVADDFNELVKWLRGQGWASYLQKVLDVNLSLEGDALRKELTKPLNESKLAALRQDESAGFDDFTGNRLIEPGFPAYSLLFHAVASPRVRPKDVSEYPSLQQIDVLENYVYAVSNWAQLKEMYGIKPADKLVFAVFAYEYRPAFKTPHHAHADMVYSRTGIARIGAEPHNYDTVNRCHTAKPASADKERTAAVMPARYALFIARVVRNTNISLVTTGIYKGKDSKDDRNDKTKFFLQPIRKVFDNDKLVGNAAKIKLAETHVSEKLKKLADTPGIEMLNKLKPQQRLSKDLLETTESVRRVGSSFLIISKHAPLLRPAMEQGHMLFFKVPVLQELPFRNRFFTAFCTQEVEDVELIEKDLQRTFNNYLAPRNQPLFVNITNKKSDTGESFVSIVRTKDRSFEDFIEKGDYYAPLFEDSICDGQVFVANTDLTLEKKRLEYLPAFSVVTAPDFFPQVDPLDLWAYDMAPGNSNETNFYEGGVASLATARIKPNPKIFKDQTEITKDTYLAVLSRLVKEKTDVPAQRIKIYKDPSSERGYEISGFLPDVASSVFAPGWDVTYCKLKNDKDIYIGTEGLGSPFIEDMKFCAALNGMWPATSPDAARTFQGSNETEYRNPTAIPLLDDELGICADGPAGKGKESWGWDGEQGPYLEPAAYGWAINFTDIGRADAVGNALTGNIDLSKLRKLKSAELIARMECLKRCIHTLPKVNFRDSFKENITAFTYLWLVSAEKVNWGKEDAPALGIPANLVGSDKTWITNKANAQVNGEGYLYVFANSECDSVIKDWASVKRRRLRCIDIYVCQVTNDPASKNKIAWAKIEKGQPVNWKVG